jgi:hypothetical protein
MIEIFVEQVSERLIYTLDFILKERDVSYKINNDKFLFEKSTNIKFNYSNLDLNNSVQIIPSELLYNEELKDYTIEKNIFNGEDCLSFNGVVDPLASVFYVLSRYEEYVSDREDMHGRFLGKYSLQEKFNWLEKSVCDLWSEAVIDFLSKKSNTKIDFSIGIVKIVPTFDIDNTYAYQWKKGFRKYLSILRDQIKFDKTRIKERKLVLAGELKDPYDTFNYIESISIRGFKVNVFWLLGDYAPYDKNISYSDIRHRELIQKMSTNSIIGLHPSYKSNSFEKIIADEKNRLEDILQREVTRSRQHFLRFKTKNTYKTLTKLGFKHEFSMGYSDKVGFRSGTARPHFWFDLNKNTVSSLMIHPFVYMDGTLNEHMKLSIEQSKSKIYNLYKEIEKHGGDFVCIWHNETIGGHGKWKGWEEVLEFTLNLSINE